MFVLILLDVSVKSTIFFKNKLTNGQQPLTVVFVWQLNVNNVMTTSITPGTPNTMTVNNLGFFSIENTATLRDKNNVNPQPQQIPVVVQYRADNLLNLANKGIWIIYNLGTTMKPAVTHDPVFGLNQPITSLTAQTITIALSGSIIVLVLILVGCSVYIYRVNTKGIKSTRVIELDNEIYYSD